MKQFTLGKNERLKSRKQIERLFKEGKTFSVTPLRVYYSLDKAITDDDLLCPLQFGVGVSTKNFKKAVDRNRVKRLLREAYRLQKNQLKENLVLKKTEVNLFFIFTGKELPDYKLIYDKVSIALQKLEQIIEQSST